MIVLSYCDDTLSRFDTIPEHGQNSYINITFIKIKLASCHLLLYVVYTCQNHLILYMRSIVTSRNVSWPRLIWPTLYLAILSDTAR